MTASALGAYPKTDKSGNVLDLKHSITDNSIVYPESFEADTRRLQEGWFVKNYTATDNRYATEPDANVSDAEMVKRLAALPTVIEMPYNQIVRSYIDRYTKQGRAQVSGLLGLSLYYMPIFEQALEEQGLPLELKYLPVIESGLNPNAVSKHGAAGLWQFMLATAKGLGMEVNSLVDERRDPYMSS
ncbi:MAG: transglycosylase SLT domain-containing protein, partial [Muribaculaceae bacterium]|nr:transglycosylase SLT domain-containing protein [Muribaculaceae bacterium]